MARHQVRPAFSQEIHSGHTGGGDATGGFGPNSGVILYPVADTSICRENPQRKVGGSTRLVTGFDADGRFNHLIPSGNTHGHWTYPAGHVQPADLAGTGGDYVARSLFHFKIGHGPHAKLGGDTGPTAGDKIQSAQLILWVNKIVNDSKDEYEYDIHRLHSPAEHAIHGQTFEFTQNATWYEHDWSGGITWGGTFNLGGLTGIAPPGTSGPRWHFEGLGVTGFTAGAASQGGDTSGITAHWSDYSGSTGNVGYGGHYQTVAGGISAGITQFPPLTFTTQTGRGGAFGGYPIQLNVLSHVIDAVDNYNGHLQLLLKLKDDHTFSTTGREFIGINSLEASENKPQLIINYRSL